MPLSALFFRKSRERELLHLIQNKPATSQVGATVWLTALRAGASDVRKDFSETKLQLQYRDFLFEKFLAPVIFAKGFLELPELSAKLRH